jgi:hypothetical protein
MGAAVRILIYDVVSEILSMIGSLAAEFRTGAGTALVLRLHRGLRRADLGLNCLEFMVSSG